MKNSILTYLLIFIFCTTAFAQEQGQTRTPGDANRVAFEQALKNYEAQKQKEQDELAVRLHASLNKKTEEWINNANQEKERLIGTRLEQNWEKLALYFPIAPSHYEYSLRNYKYTVIKSDVSKTNSLSSPYKADVVISEELYVEKNHSPDISDPVPYFYTVTTAYTLHFNSRGDNFELLNTEKKIINIENKVPADVIRPTFR